MRSPLSKLRRRQGRRRGTHPLIIAAVVILIPVFIVYYAFSHKIPFLSSSYTDYAIVANSVNVRPGAPVRISGIDVGTVSGVQADGNASRIAFNIDAEGRPIHQDATMTIRDRLFLEGSYYLQLDPGSPSAPLAREGFTIPEASTASPVQFFQLLSTFDTSARDSLKNIIATSDIAFGPSAGQPESNSGAGAFKTAIPELTPDLRNGAEIAQALTGTHANDVETLLRSTAQLTGVLADHRNQLADGMAKIDVVLGTLAGEDDAVGATIGQVDDLLRQTPSDLVAINRSLGPTDTLAAALTPALRQSPVLVSGLSSELQRVNAIITPAQRPKLIGSLTTLLVDFPTSATALAGFFPPVEPSALCLADRVTPLLEEQVRDGAHSTGDPVWKDLVHMLPNLAAASGNYDANGPYLRALIGVGNNSLTGLASGLTSGLSSTLSGTPASGASSTVTGAANSVTGSVGSLLGSLPGVGPLIGSIAGTATGSSSSNLEGIAPTWVGDLTAADFRPDVSCTSQPLPTNLQANPALADG